MLFNFKLDSVDEIAPWTTPSEDDKKSLSWFGLTSGEYWLTVGGDELFRYSPALLEHWGRQFPAAPTSSYVNYEVARLWEDLLDGLPIFLDPLPDDLARRVEAADAWQSWRGKATRWYEETDDEQALDLYDVALRWWMNRTWDAAYLRCPPHVWFWTVGETVHIRWDNRGILLDGLPVWEAVRGEFILSVAAFMAEVDSFHARFLAAMDERVRAVRSHWGRPDIFVDRDRLEQEQQTRSEWPAHALRRTFHEHYEWDDVRAALSTLAAHLPG